MRKLLLTLAALAVIAAAAGWILSAPRPLGEDAVAGLTGDPEHGAMVFWAGGCAACHAAPGAEGEARLVLAGGYRMESPFGTFVAPNISPAPEGIAGWSTLDLANALKRGVSPGGAHYYPALPYGTYTRMTMQDVADLKAFMDTLPPSDVASQPHDLTFPFTIRRSLGLWKLLFLNDDWIRPADTPELERGRYLAEALGHCAECHTPRNALGALDTTRWMQGAPNPSGKGTIPAINAANLAWTAQDIVYYLETGFTPDYDSAGGEMAQVVKNIANLPPEDRAAIAAYIKAVP
ncbi:c-type cytochrome [Seohaeicola nanhaiensis]|uniref:C-type cytochrome n=1 Tax=Seohaeicola nanhaiensis TaxID=1387282 RepID=A0ABV9KQ73_9RHOB